MSVCVSVCHLSNKIIDLDGGSLVGRISPAWAWVFVSCQMRWWLFAQMNKSSVSMSVSTSVILCQLSNHMAALSLPRGINLASAWLMSESLSAVESHGIYFSSSPLLKLSTNHWHHQLVALWSEEYLVTAFTALLIDHHQMVALWAWAWVSLRLFFLHGWKGRATGRQTSLYL